MEDVSVTRRADAGLLDAATPVESHGEQPLSAASRLRGRDLRIALVLGVLGGIAGGAIVFASLREHLPSDFQLHLAFTIEGIHGHALPGNFLFYALDALFAGFSTDLWWLKLSLVFVLTCAIAAKVAVSIRFVASERRIELPAARGPLPLWLACVTLACAFAFSLPVHSHYYLGQIPPNIWHNSTTIVLMPFAVGLFWTTMLYLRSGERRYLWWSVPLAALNLAAKPSFVLCMLPVFAIAAVLRFRLGWTPKLRGAALLLTAIVALLGLQYLYIYIVDPTTADGGSGVAINPFVVWDAYSSTIPLSILASYVFPIVALVLGGASVRRSLSVRYAIGLAVVGLIEYAVLAERGVRRFDGNFTWQAIVTNYVLFVALVAALVPLFESRRWGVRQVCIAAAFLAQLAAGVLYVQHWFANSSFV
ncbi:MAG: hypothetical protein JWQ48_3660 [Conexibacter sp.]|nr:hypothetical protein [Conexibacter sp.]